MNELLWLAMLALNFAAIIVCYRLFGKIGLFIWIPISVILANIQVVKTVDLFRLSATLGNIVYATSFLATDILSENYGKKDAKRAVYIGFFSLIVMAGFMNLALLFKPAPEDFAQESLVTIFNLVPRIAGASLLAYWISQLHDVWAYQYWKKKFPSSKFIWIRNNASTIVSQLIDSVIFTLAAFAGTFPRGVLFEIVISTYLLKVLVAAADTPFVYLARWMKKKGVIPGESPG
jgi:queuosine precursor transporter